MAKYFLEMFGVSLGLTILLELPVGICFGMRSRKNILLLLLVNILTNPPAVFICWLGCPEILVETVVMITEAMIYTWFSRDENWVIARPVALSVTANTISWLTGVLIQIVRSFL